MKCIISALFIFLINSEAYVLNNAKYETTTKAIDYEADYKNLSERLFGTNEVLMNNSSDGTIYLDDVIFGLKSQNWGSDEMSCLNDTLHVIKGLQNYTLWAVWEWDSVSSQPLGILSGNRYQLGYFDQCMTAPWRTSHPEIKTQYCLAEVVLEKSGSVKKKRLQEVEPYENAIDFIRHNTPYFRSLKYLTWGACVPASCGPKSVERLVGTVLARSHLGAAGLRPRITVNETCQRPDRLREYDGLFYGFIAMCGVMVFLCTICTILNRYQVRSHSQCSRIKNVVEGFCLVKIAKDLLKVHKDGLEVLYGIKYLTICFIVICHEAGFTSAGPISNGLKVDKDLMVFGWVLLHDDLLVDTFFVISGFLVAKTITQNKTLPNIFVIILKRYLRLTVGLAVVVFFLAAVFPFIGSGPLWERFVNIETGSCRQNGWSNILMLSNYIDPENICLLVSWYIPCDFHFFVVAVLVLALYRKWPKLGAICAGAIAVASVVTPGVINYINNLNAIQLFTFEFMSNPRGNEQFHVTYIKSHTRAAAYITGYFAGCIFVNYKTKNANYRLSQTKAVLGVCAGLAIMVLVTVLGVSYHFRSYSEIEGTLYAALNRPVWAGGVVLLILCCGFGKVPWVTAFLSWYPWVPLSRLAYGLYLIHSVVITRNVAVARNSVQYDNFNVFMDAISVIVVSTFLALILWLFFEAPINNLLSIYFKKKYTKTLIKEDTEQVDGNRSLEQNSRTNGGYIEDNLPDKIQFSSKM